MEEEAGRIPPGRTETAEKARVQQLRGDVELRSAAGEPVRVWSGSGTSWTVILEDAKRVSAYGGPRTLQVTALPGVAALLDALAEDAAHLQSAGVAGLEAPDEVAEALAGVGVTRIVPLSEMAFPPAWWLHDGEGPLRSLVRWTEWSD